MLSSLSLCLFATLVFGVPAPAPVPQECRKLPTDADWPAPEVWKAALKGVEARGAQKANNTMPDYFYEANTIKKVMNAVNFAREHNIRLSVLNSGHDFIGRNNAPSGLSLQISDFKGIKILPSFTPDTATYGDGTVNYTTKPDKVELVPGQQAAVTIGAGVNIDELNKALRVYGLYSIGAAHDSVAVAGGWSQAGGHAALSSYFGLGSDQILEYRVVTADGYIRIVNERSNQDLYWAMRGGGGGTWGVVVEATLKVYPQPKINVYRFYINTTDYNDEKSIWQPAAYFHSQIPRLNTLGGFQGYYYIRPNAMSAMFLCPNEFSNVTNMRAIMDPVLDKMATFPGMSPSALIKAPLVDITTLLGNAGSLQSTTGGASAPMPAMAGMPGMPGMQMIKRHGPGEDSKRPMYGVIDQDSSLLGEDELTHPKLAEALEKSMRHGDTGQYRGHLVGGNKVFKNKDIYSAVHPKWRSAYVHLMVTGNEKVYQEPIRALSKDGVGAAYINEGHHKLINWKQRFFGPGYDTLLVVKKKYDPDNLFWVTPGVGADLMEVKDGRVCKVGIQNKMLKLEPPQGDNLNETPYVKEVPSFPKLWMGEGKKPLEKPLEEMKGNPA